MDAMRTTGWDVGGVAEFGAAVVLPFDLVAGKLAGDHIAGSILKWEKDEASIIGWLLQTEALNMMIFANILLDKAIITNETFIALLLMAVGSTTLTIPIVTLRLRKLAGLSEKTG